MLDFYVFNCYIIAVVKDVDSKSEDAFPEIIYHVVDSKLKPSSTIRLFFLVLLLVNVISKMSILHSFLQFPLATLLYSFIAPWRLFSN